MEGRFVAQLNCAEDAVMALACTLEMARSVGVDEGALCDPPGLTTPAQPPSTKLNVIIIAAAASCENRRLLAERAALSIFFDHPSGENPNIARAKKLRPRSSRTWRLLSATYVGNWTHDANEGNDGGRIHTGL